MLGALFAAGFGPDALDLYTWDQLGLMGECIGLHYAGLLEGVLGPVASVLGVKYKPGKVSRGRERKPTEVDYSDLDAVKRAKARDARILMGAGGLQGVSIEL